MSEHEHDDVPTDADFARQQEMAERFMDQLDAQCEEAGEDYLGVAYAVWIELTRHLAMGGWSAHELVADTRFHGRSAEERAGAAADEYLELAPGDPMREAAFERVKAWLSTHYDDIHTPEEVADIDLDVSARWFIEQREAQP